MATLAVAGPSNPRHVQQDPYRQQYAMLSRPQIGIERLHDARRPASNEPKEAMNCKSCRKRKIKCNRVKPSCEACQIFNCACVYDAVPKKRGPKTDVLEALVKRVNGLEKRLKDDGKPESALDGSDGDNIDVATGGSDGNHGQPAAIDSPEVPFQPVYVHPGADNSHAYSNPPPQSLVPPQEASSAFTNTLLDAFFNRLHGKPYYILDPPATRQRVRDNTLPRFVLNSIYAVSIHFAFHLCGGQKAAIAYSKECARQARAEIEVDEPNIDHVQALMLLSLAGFRAGRGKAAYMLRSHATNMALALNLHRELPPNARVSAAEREGRRRLFWSCYLMDRIVATGSKRPSIISDEAISLRLPVWMPPGAHIVMDGNYFPNGSSLPYAAGVSNASQGSGAMLVEIARVLGTTNRYLASGGVNGDSHFPWHSQSTLSRIRSDLDYWAANTQESFSSIENLFSQSDSSTLVLSKLLYHLIHCLIYRPFLPISLSDLNGTGQHQSWQIESTNLCFLHANAIAELVEISKSHPIDWPPFVSYCVCVAGTVHVHGAHYMSVQEGDPFFKSNKYLIRAMAQLADFRCMWAGSQHDLETLQTVYFHHTELMKLYASNPAGFATVSQMEDFFDRYPGTTIDGSHVTFGDIDIDRILDAVQPYNGPAMSMDSWMAQPHYNVPPAPVPPQYITQNLMPGPQRRVKRRRTDENALPYPSPALSGTIHRPAEPNTVFEQPQPADFGGQQPIASAQNSAAQTYNEETIPTNSYTQNVQDGSQPYGGMQQQQNTNDAQNYYDLQTSYNAVRLEQHTPSGLSVSNESNHTDPDKDPFLSLLEQLAQNDGSINGPTDLDFFLGGGQHGEAHEFH